MRWKIRYPKFLLLFLSIVLAYLLFQTVQTGQYHESLLALGYFGTFLCGMMFAYGFTAAPATALLLVLSKSQNLYIAGIVAGFGALAADLLIFTFIREYFAEELDSLSKEKFIVRFRASLPVIVRRYLIPVFGGFVIASPLPDEIGVFLLAASQNTSLRLFSILCYALNTAGIFVVLYIGRSL